MRHDCPEFLSKGDRLAWQINWIKAAFDGASGAMKVTPFFTANNREELINILGMFAEDIENGANELRVFAGINDKDAFDHEATHSDAIAIRLLAQPCEKRVVSEFNRARSAVGAALDELKKTVQHNECVSQDAAVDAIVEANWLYNVVRGTQEFYRRVPAEAAQNFTFR